jgi:hypothetical protein
MLQGRKKGETRILVGIQFTQGHGGHVFPYIFSLVALSTKSAWKKEVQWHFIDYEVKSTNIGNILW